jgi:uncharacterized protein (TIGR00266 family)
MKTLRRQPVSDISYQIHGSDLQYVEVTLVPGASVIGEQGAMMYMDPGVVMTAVLGDGSTSSFGVIGRFFRAVKRSFSGESLFSGRYRNESPLRQRVAFAVPSVSKIVAVNLDELGGELICQRGAYLAGEEGLQITLAMQKRLRVGFFGGEGFFMQRITGSGTVFISSSGAQAEMVLQPGQQLQVDSGCLVALSPSVTYEIKYAGKIKTALFGGEGLFYARLTGPGQVWLQSLPDRRLGATLMRAAFSGRGGSNWSGKAYLLFIIVAIVATVMDVMPS